jgi:predicted GNAT family N-acyltransferase
LECKNCVKAGGRYLGNRHFNKCIDNSAKKLKDKAAYRSMQKALEEFYTYGGVIPY